MAMPMKSRRPVKPNVTLLMFYWINTTQESSEKRLYRAKTERMGGRNIGLPRHEVSVDWLGLNALLGSEEHHLTQSPTFVGLKVYCRGGKKECKIERERREQSTVSLTKAFLCKRCSFRFVAPRPKRRNCWQYSPGKFHSTVVMVRGPLFKYCHLPTTLVWPSFRFKQVKECPPSVTV